MHVKLRRQAFKVALIYFVVASLWILLSDDVLDRLVSTPGLRDLLAIIKDGLFVLLTAGLLYGMIWRLLRKGERETEQRQQAEVARQQMVDQLHHSEEQLRLILAASADGFWDWNIRPDMAELSPRFWEIIGYSDDEVSVNLAFMKRVIHPDDLSFFLATLDDHLAGKSAQFAGDFRIVTKHGRIRWTWFRGRVMVRSADGSPLRMAGIISDTTERKQAEIALAESQSRMRAVMDSTTDLIWSVDARDFGMQTFNRAADDYFRRERDLVLRVGQSLEEFFPGPGPASEFLNAWKGLFRRALESGPFTTEYVMYLGKSTMLLTLCPLRHEGTVFGISVFARDITERKQAEQQISLQLSALTSAANAIIITDANGRIEWVNPAFTKLSGYTPEEAIGRFPRLLKSGQHPPEFYASLWTTVRSGQVWHGEMVNKRKDGRFYAEDMMITPVRNADGQIGHYVAVKQDITERRQLEGQLRQAQKMEAIGTLAGGIAHDFNNMLAAIFGYSYLLQQDTNGNAAAQENIEAILKAATRAKELVKQILTFSRQREQKREVVRLGAIVQEAIKFLRASLPAQVEIELNLAGDAPAVLADPTQVFQVTINLATNALHAMEGRPGRLTVRVDSFVPDEDFVKSHPHATARHYARLTVADTGHGMDAKTVERIFEPFFTTKSVGKGTGLGLSMVHGIVAAHQGIITVASEVGQGSTLSLYFPAVATPAKGDAAAVAPSAPGRGQQILYIDDEAALTVSFRQLLERMNYQVTTSNHALEALELFRQNPARFDLVITDLTMPEMNGLEVARRIHGRRPELPLVLASGFAPELSRENLEAAGIRELMEKPFSTTILAGVLQRTLGADGNAAPVR